MIENANGVVGLELFGNGSQLGGVPLISGTASTLYFPHMAFKAGEGWWNYGVVAYNPSTTTTVQITVYCYKKDGTLLGSPSRSLGPRERFMWPFPTAGISVPAGTEWIKIQSDEDPLIGFELFGTTDSKRLAGYSVVDIEGGGDLSQGGNRVGVAGPALPLSIRKTMGRRFTSMHTITLAERWDRQR